MFFYKYRNSALTEFLNERNIQASVIRQRYLQLQNGEQEGAGEENDENQEEYVEIEGESSELEPESSATARRKRRKVAFSDSESEGEGNGEGSKSKRKDKGKLNGEAEGKIKELTKRQQKRLARRQQSRRSGNDGISSSSSSSESDSDLSDLGSSDEGSRRRSRRRRLNRRYMNEENDEAMFRRANKNKGRLPGQTDFCALCHAKFTVSVYSESAPQEVRDKIKEEREKKKLERELKKLERERNLELLSRIQDGNDQPQHAIENDSEEEDEDEEDDLRLEDTLLLCQACSRDHVHKEKSSSRTLEAHSEATRTSKLYRRKVAAALLDRREYSDVPSLQETCIQVIVENIEDVEALGELSFRNRDRIARILSRNRILNTTTVKLFLDPSVKDLELWDCSQINSDTLNLIPAYCPYLENLTLSMCGQVRSEFLNKCATQLTSLKEVHLDGAFLVSAGAWADFFSTIGERLEKIDIRNTHRFTAESLAILIECCPNLTHLTLHRLSGLSDPAGYLLISGLPNLVHLDLSHPPQDVVMAKDAELITDETIITILNSVGSQLQTLVLDGCSELTDRFVTDGLRPCCSPLRLKRLSLANIDQLTDEVMADLFHTWSETLSRLNSDPIMTSLSLERCIGLTDGAVGAMFEFSRPSIVTLNISALPDVTEQPFREAFVAKTDDEHKNSQQFPQLESVNVSFVQSLTNSLVESMAEAAPRLEFLEIFGVSNVDKKCAVRPGVKLIGRLDSLDL